MVFKVLGDDVGVLSIVVLAEQAIIAINQSYLLALLAVSLNQFNTDVAPTNHNDLLRVFGDFKELLSVVVILAEVDVRVVNPGQVWNHRPGTGRYH